MQRKFPRKIKRIVIKVGSSVIATYRCKPRVAHLKSLVSQIASIQRQGIDVVLVSSGAIVLGMGEVKVSTRPNDLSSLQAIAAIGQTVLMKKYTEFFKSNKVHCGQVLLTWDDFDNRKRFNNARNTFQSLFDLNIVPVVNENDTISTDEIKFGDNDKLSAMVASLVDADLLLILSDVEGLYDYSKKDDALFDEVKEITAEIERIAGGTTKKKMSKGGMTAKLDAVKIATSAKIPCIIAHGESENVLKRVLKGERIGTFFVEREQKTLAKKHWISFGAKPKGVITVDTGARKALQDGGKSLLLPGIVSIEGSFKKDDVVIVQDKKNIEIARGMISYSSSELNKIGDKRGKQEAIHRDNLVLCER